MTEPWGAGVGAVSVGQGQWVAVFCLVMHDPQCSKLAMTHQPNQPMTHQHKQHSVGCVALCSRKTQRKWRTADTYTVTCCFV